MGNGYTTTITSVLNGGCMITNRKIMCTGLTDFPNLFGRTQRICRVPKLDQDIHVDAVIVGGGITGITAAYLLVNKGVKVAIVEANKLLNGTTGHTTAKITAQHDLIYDELINKMGINKARLYYEANTEALNFIKKTIDQHQIDCDFSPQDAYMYSTTEEYKEKIQKEFKAYERLNIDGELVDTIPLDIKVENALIMKNQAQFHPLKYLKHLVQNITEKGGLIFENTVAENVDTGYTANSPYTRRGQSYSRLCPCLFALSFL